MTERKVFVVAVMLSKSEPGRSTTSFTQHIRSATCRAEAVESSLLSAREAKPGFAIEEWLVSEVTPDMFVPKEKSE